MVASTSTSGLVPGLAGGFRDRIEGKEKNVDRLEDVLGGRDFTDVLFSLFFFLLNKFQIRQIVKWVVSHCAPNVGDFPSLDKQGGEVKSVPSTRVEN